MKTFLLFALLTLSTAVSTKPLLDILDTEAGKRAFETAFTEMEKENEDEPFCVMKVGTRCPRGFLESNLRLSMRSTVGQSDRDRNKTRLINMGYAGASSLKRDSYEAIYMLDMYFCCKPK